MYNLTSNNVYAANSGSLPLKIEDDEDQPLDFSTGKSFRDSAVPNISRDWLNISRPHHSSSSIDSKSPIQHSFYLASPISPGTPKSPVRQMDTYMSPLSPATPNSPKRKSRKSRSPESGVSSGSISPGRTSPINIPLSYSSRLTRDTGAYSNQSYSSVPIGLPTPPAGFGQPVNYANTLSVAELSRANYAMVAQFNALHNLGMSSISALHNPVMNPNLMLVPQDQNDYSCSRNLQEKLHITAAEMPTVCTSHFITASTFEQMQLGTKASLQKFQREVMLKKRDDNPSKSRRSAARTAPYSSNGRTDSRAFDEGGQDSNGDSQGESVDMEVDVRTRQYQEKRRKNNEAAKKSRDQRKNKEEETAIRAAFYEAENAKLSKYIIGLQVYLNLFRKGNIPC